MHILLPVFTDSSTPRTPRACPTPCYLLVPLHTLCMVCNNCVNTHHIPFACSSFSVSTHTADTAFGKQPHSRHTQYRHWVDTDADTSTDADAVLKTGTDIRTEQGTGAQTQAPPYSHPETLQSTTPAPTCRHPVPLPGCRGFLVFCDHPPAPATCTYPPAPLPRPSTPGSNLPPPPHTHTTPSPAGVHHLSLNVGVPGHQQPSHLPFSPAPTALQLAILELPYTSPAPPPVASSPAGMHHLCLNVRVPRHQQPSQSLLGSNCQHSRRLVAIRSCQVAGCGRLRGCWCAGQQHASMLGNLHSTVQHSIARWMS
jgi:hypothetical protein